MRTTGATNVQPFDTRTQIETSSNQDVRHLSAIKGNPRDQFLGLLKHQKSYLQYIETRHDRIIGQKKTIETLNSQLDGLKSQVEGDNANSQKLSRAGAKDATFAKYRWYSEQLIILEAINAFETFYKKSFIGLGEIIQSHVKPEEMKDRKIDARLLWTITDPLSVPALVFEQCLFHDLDSIDEAANLLVQDKRYKQNSNPNSLKGRVRHLKAIFQIRHTLSHNCGLVTGSDAAKFKRLGYAVNSGEVIDPNKNHFGIVILRELESEAKDFTAWLAQKTSSFLIDCAKNGAGSINSTIKLSLEKHLGCHPDFATVPWF